MASSYNNIDIERLRHGDEAEFRKLVDKYNRKIYSIAFRLTRNHTDADDITQETFIRAYRALERFQGRSSLSTWLFRIALNCSRDHLRKRKRLGEVDLDERVVNGRSRPAAEVGGGMEAGEIREAVARAIDSLPFKQRSVLLLHSFEGMAHADIARVMGCSVGTVRSRLHYARERLRGKLKYFSLPTTSRKGKI